MMDTSAPMCKVCLAGDRRMVNIDSIHLLEFYEKLTDTKLNTEAVDGMGSAVCYICHSELQKCYRLNQTANKSQECIQAMLNNGIQVTYDMVTLRSPAIKQSLSVAPVQFMFLNDPSKTGSTPLPFKEEKVVKEEKNSVEAGDIVDEMKFEVSDEEVEGDIDEMTFKASDEEVEGDSDTDVMKFEASDEEFQIG